LGDGYVAEPPVAADVTPLEYILSIMQDESLDLSTRIQAAKAALPYCHARLAPIEAAGRKEDQAKPLAERVLEHQRRLDRAQAIASGKLIELQAHDA
jgi:hypothetical protein